MTAWTYILASDRNGTLYTGSTDDIERRMWEHRHGIDARFTARYRVHRLVWYVHFDLLMEARSYEWQIKRWRRAWKLKLIEDINPDWRDLYDDLNG